MSHCACGVLVIDLSLSVFILLFLVLLFFFFKQKTAYEMRISDWSSDVCSSDLAANDSLAAELFGFHGHACFAGDDVLHQVIHVRLGDVSYTSRSEKGNDVPADTADIGGDGGVLLRPAAFA